MQLAYCTCLALYVPVGKKKNETIIQKKWLCACLLAQYHNLQFFLCTKGISKEFIISKSITFKSIISITLKNVSTIINCIEYIVVDIVMRLIVIVMYVDDDTMPK